MNIMFGRATSVLVAFTCWLIASPARAAESWNSSVIISGGYTKQKNGCDSPLLTSIIPGPSCSENNTSLRFAIDHQFTPVWGIEISYGDLGKSKENGILNLIGGGPTSWAMTATGWTIAGTETLHISDGFSVLGKIGLVHANFSESQDAIISGSPYVRVSYNGVGIINVYKNNLTAGVGLQYDFGASYAIRVQYENFGSYNIYSAYGVSRPPNIQISAISAGMVLKF